MDLLQVKNLNIAFKVSDGQVYALSDISLDVKENEIVGIVGESGSGKTQLVLTIMGLLAKNALVNGSIKFMGQELIGLATNKLNKLRGNQIAMIFQDPTTSLNPYLTIASQMTEVLILHKKFSYKQALLEAIKMLDIVNIPDAKNRVNLYPHEFSGGMRQRIMIAMALLCKPKLLIADEPTTALDVTTQAQILKLLRDLKAEFNMSIIFITHDMGVVANICDRINVMYAGNLMETGTTQDIFYNARHPYTQALLESIPSMEQELSFLKTIPGEPPNLMELSNGCQFRTRCKFSHKNCAKTIPLVYIRPRTSYKCNLIDNPA